MAMKSDKAKALLIGQAASKYNILCSKREEWLSAAERFSALTLPSVMPEEDSPIPDQKVIPHNNTGAQGVNTLGSKMSLQLLPPQEPFFRMEIKPDAKKLITTAMGNSDPAISDQATTIQQEIKDSLIDLENRLTMEIGRENLRSNANEVFKQLLVTGNVLFLLPEKGATSVITLRNFVVKRDPSGNVLHVIVKEKVSEVALTEAQKLAMGIGEAAGIANEVMSSKGTVTPLSNEDAPGAHDNVDIYTIAERVGPDSLELWQEVNGTMVAGSWKKYKNDYLPFLVLRWTETPNEDYGHSYVSDYEGDLLVLEGLSKAIKDAAVASSRMLFGISRTAPVGLERKLSTSANGSFHRFDQNEVHVLQINKLADLNMAAQTAQEAQQRLRQAFLLNSTRNAERVTAEEIRLNYQELQAALGGAFAQLSNTFQIPLLRRLMVRLKARGGLVGLENAIAETEPIIVSGVDALGRNTEMSNLIAFTQALSAAIGPGALASILNPEELAIRMANSTNVKPDRLIKSAEQQLQEKQADQLTEIGTRAAGPVGAAAMRAVEPGSTPYPQETEGAA